MKYFIKNSYLFLILFIILVSKDYVLGFFANFPNIKIKDNYVQKLETELNDISLIESGQYKSNYYLAKVLYQNPYKIGYLQVLINDDKIKKNDYVLANNSLIGVVDKVYKNRAEVKLINSDDFIMQVSVNDCYGILKNLAVWGVDNYCTVNIGDEVYTSNLGYLNDKVLIGTINDIENDLNEVSDIYKIKPSQRFANLNYLLIIGGE